MNKKIKLFFEFRTPIITYTLLFVAIFILFIFGHNFQPLSSSQAQIGSLILFAGFGIRVLASITSKYMGKIKITGIYAICRHPFLLAQIVSLIGLNVIVSNIYFLTISAIVFICNDYFSSKKYDKILSHHYRDIWRIYAKHTNFLLPITSRVKDVFSGTLSQSEFENGQNTPIFFMIYAILVEIATFSNL